MTLDSCSESEEADAKTAGPGPRRPKRIHPREAVWARQWRSFFPARGRTATRSEPQSPRKRTTHAVIGARIPGLKPGESGGATDVTVHRRGDSPARTRATYIGAAALTLGLASILAPRLDAGAAPASPNPHVHPELAAHQARIAEPTLVRVSEHVYAAIGFDLGNLVFIVGDEGVVVYDTGTSLEVGRDALAALREHTDKPIVAVIYSHGHLDHVGGVRAFVPPGREAAIPIYANRRWPHYRTEQAIQKTPLRGLYQMGGALPTGDAGVVGNGGGPVFRMGSSGFLPPTILVDDELEFEAVGVKIRLFHAPGDVADGLAAWLPEEGVLLAGDAYYPMFPALSTPRFDRHRDAWRNLETLDRFRKLGAEHVVPGHLWVISGREQVAQHLTAFRDAIQFMHDQTIRLLARGYGQTETANQIRASFPAHLAADPDLAEYYQRLEWVVKGIYAKTGGWYGGDAVELVQIGPRERARRLATLAGGSGKLRLAAESAYAVGDRAWAAELARSLVLADPEDARSRELLADILRSIGFDAKSANLRNYMLTEALVVDGSLDLDRLPRRKTAPDLLRSVDDSVLFRGLGVRLDPEQSRDVEFTAGFTFHDTGAQHGLVVRHGVIEYLPERPAEADLRVVLERETWLAIAGGNLSWLDALHSEAAEASSKEALARFEGFFDDR